jgi:hypothetical protein
LAAKKKEIDIKEKDRQTKEFVACKRQFRCLFDGSCLYRMMVAVQQPLINEALSEVEHGLELLLEPRLWASSLSLL